MCHILHAGYGTCLSDRRSRNRWPLMPDCQEFTRGASYRTPMLPGKGPGHTGTGAEEAQGKEHTGQTAPPFRRRGPPR